MIEKISDNVILIMMILMILLSIIVQIMIGVLYQKLIEETENMELIRYKKLGRFKEKFTKFYQLNNNINNIPVSVEKFLNK